jgi:hypothetical protein
MKTGINQVKYYHAIIAKKPILNKNINMIGASIKPY